MTAVDYDFEDKWTLPAENVYPVTGSFERTEEGGICGAVSEATFAFAQPGSHFASVRVKANRCGNAEDIYTQVKNIARVRVIVEQR